MGMVVEGGVRPHAEFGVEVITSFVYIFSCY